MCNHEFEPRPVGFTDLNNCGDYPPIRYRCKKCFVAEPELRVNVRFLITCIKVGFIVCGVTAAIIGLIRISEIFLPAR